VTPFTCVLTTIHLFLEGLVGFHDLLGLSHKPDNTNNSAIHARLSMGGLKIQISIDDRSSPWIGSGSVNFKIRVDWIWCFLDPDIHKIHGFHEYSGYSRISPIPDISVPLCQPPAQGQHGGKKTLTHLVRERAIHRVETANDMAERAEWKFRSGISVPGWGFWSRVEYSWIGSGSYVFEMDRIWIWAQIRSNSPI